MGRGKHLTGKIEGGGKILTHEEVLQILSEMARNGSVTAATTLLRVLPPDHAGDLDDELDRLLRDHPAHGASIAERIAAGMDPVTVGRAFVDSARSGLGEPEVDSGWSLIDAERNRLPSRKGRGS